MRQISIGILAISSNVGRKSGDKAVSMTRATFVPSQGGGFQTTPLFSALWSADSFTTSSFGGAFDLIPLIPSSEGVTVEMDNAPHAGHLKNVKPCNRSPLMRCGGNS